MSKRDDKKLLETARDRFKKCVDADRDNRRLAIDDLTFLNEPGAQWDEVTKTERGNRPCYEFNKLRVSVKRVINDIRANRAQGKVRAVEDGDTETAEIMEGLTRNIWNVSDGDAAVDMAAEYSVGGGMGSWRVNTKYADDSAWDQDIVIEQIRNPFALWCDPASRDPMKRDAEYWFLESRISKDAYEAQYGDKQAVEWESSEFDDDDEWQDDDRVRICEYWYRKPITKTLALLSDGSTVDMATLTPESLVKMTEQGPVQLQVMRTRDVQTYQLCMAIISGDKVLEGPIEWAGKYFPFVVVYGEYLIIDGKVKWFGLTRFAKDAQRLHNANMTYASETVALAPQSKWWATTAQAQGHTDLWAKAHKENLPYLTYNPDPQAPGAPPRMAGAEVPAAFSHLAMISGEEIKAVTGIYDASLGNQSNETSGIAIRSRQQQGEISNFNYGDNVARGIRYTWEILCDLIPKIYDAERTVRIIGSDGAEAYKRINAVDINGMPVNDLSRGKYDVAITVGPSFTTQRQEAAEIYSQMAQAFPPLMQIGGDLVMKSFDLPYAEDMADRLKAMLPPPIQQMLQSKDGGKPLPPEVMQVMAQAQQAMQQVEQQGQLVQQAAQEAEGIKAEAEKSMAQLDAKKAELNAEYQRMLADIAKREAQLVLKDANLTAKQTQDGLTQDSQAVQADRENLSQQLQTSLADIQKGVAEFMTQAASTILQIQQSAQPQVVVANQPRQRTVRVKRINGELVGSVEEH